MDKQKKYNDIINNLEKMLPKKINKEIRPAILLVMLSKYIKTIKAIKLLDEEGFFEDAQSLLRTLIEITIIIAYAEKKEHSIYKRYDDFAYVIKKKFIKDMISLNPKFSDNFNKNPRELELTNNIYDSYAEEYGVNTRYWTRYWNGKTFKDTVYEVANEYQDEEFKYIYEIIYKSCCDYIHTNSNIFLDNYVKISQSEDVFYYKIDAIPNENEDKILEDIILITKKFTSIFPNL